MLKMAIQRYSPNMAEAARRLGIDRKTLWRKMREHGLARSNAHRKQVVGTLEEDGENIV